MIMKPPKNLRLWWDETTGWVVDVPFGVSLLMLKAVCDQAKPTQIQRYTHTPPGDKRERIAASIRDLESYKVTQRITGVNNDNKSDRIVYGAT